jgi:hypothetical protein
MKSTLESKSALIELILAIDDRDANLNDDELHALIKYCAGVLIRRKCAGVDKSSALADRIMEMNWGDENDDEPC